MIYYEVYRRTHKEDGALMYNRYFTTLEALVNASHSQYYPHGVLYKDTGYVFIEDFVLSVDETILHRILQ